jgi:hypothetical protein
MSVLPVLMMEAGNGVLGQSFKSPPQNVNVFHFLRSISLNLCPSIEKESPVYGYIVFSEKLLAKIH